MIGSTRHLEASFATIEWLMDDDELTDEEQLALQTTHEVLCRKSNDVWGVQPPKLPEKVGDVPLHAEMDEDYYRNEY